MKKTIILLCGATILLSTLFGQSNVDFQDMYDLYKKSQSMNLEQSPFGKQSTSINKDNLDQQLRINYITNPKIKEASTGHWKSKQDYKTWLEETSGDDAVKNLYGYVPLVSKHFGYDIFVQRDSIALMPNVSIPDYYILGPGDKIEIALWGSAQLYEVLMIDRDGNIFDQNIGKVALVGKTLKEARKILKNRFSQKYSSIKGDYPSSFISITLTDIKSINVHYTGYVELPGLHIISPLSTVITGLYQSGGVNTSGTLRNIQIIRNSDLFKEIDIYDYLLKGDLRSEIISVLFLEFMLVDDCLLVVS